MKNKNKNWRNALTPGLGSKIVGDIVLVVVVVFTWKYIHWWSILFGFVMGTIANILTDDDK